MKERPIHRMGSQWVIDYNVHIEVVTSLIFHSPIGQYFNFKKRLKLKWQRLRDTEKN